MEIIAPIFRRKMGKWGWQTLLSVINLYSKSVNFLKEKLCEKFTTTLILQLRERKGSFKYVQFFLNRHILLEEGQK